MSDGQPEPQLAISYDHPSGIYVGAFASKVDLEENRSDVQTNVYAGYAGRLSSRMTWELGATETMFDHASYWNYGEIYAGLGYDNLEGRIYFSPHYFGEEIHTVYMELNGTYPLSDRWHLLAHIGTLHSSSDLQYLSTGTRQDYRIGVSTKVSDWTLQLEWAASDDKQNQYRYPVYRPSSPSTLVFDASYSF